MATDLWPDEDSNPIVAGLDIGFFYANATCTESRPVKLATGVAGIIKCQNATALGDAFGYALKSVDAGEYLPVATSGVLKVLVDGSTVVTGHLNITTGDMLMNSAALFAVKVVITTATCKTFYGSSYVLGMALQPSTVSADEILLLLGKTL